MNTLLPPPSALSLVPNRNRTATGAGSMYAAGTAVAKWALATSGEFDSDEAATAGEAALILSALDAADEACEPDVAQANLNRRSSVRAHYRTRGHLRLFADAPDALPWTIFTRNVSDRSAGFISPDRLPLGYGGTLTLPTPDGPPLRLDVTLTRCSSCCGGWYYGAMAFNRPVPVFERLLP